MVTNEQALKFYHSRMWRQARLLALVRDNYQCQRCKQRGLIKEGNIVHHIVPLKEDWDRRTELDNLETICADCHNQEHPEKAANYSNKSKLRHLKRERSRADVFSFTGNDEL